MAKMGNLMSCVFYHDFFFELAKQDMLVSPARPKGHPCACCGRGVSELGLRGQAGALQYPDDG